MNAELINAVLTLLIWSITTIVLALVIAAAMLRRYRKDINPAPGPTIIGEASMTLIIKNDHPAFGIVVTPPVVKDAEGEIIPLDTSIESSNGNTLRIIRDENDQNRAAVDVGSSGDAAIFVHFATKEGQQIKVLSRAFHVTHGDPKDIEGGDLTFLGLEDATSDEPPAPVEPPQTPPSTESAGAAVDTAATETASTGESATSGDATTDAPPAETSTESTVESKTESPTNETTSGKQAAETAA